LSRGDGLGGIFCVAPQVHNVSMDCTNDSCNRLFSNSTFTIAFTSFTLSLYPACQRFPVAATLVTSRTHLRVSISSGRELSPAVSPSLWCPEGSAIESDKYFNPSNPPHFAIACIYIFGFSFNLEFFVPCFPFPPHYCLESFTFLPV